VTDRFTGSLAATMGDSVNYVGRLGSTLVFSGESQVNSTHVFVTSGGGLVARPGSFASYGTIYGRVAAHEVITHGFIPSPADAYLPEDIRTPWRQRENVTRGGGRFSISDSTAAALRAGCP
jgi:hypothetical protein